MNEKTYVFPEGGNNGLDPNLLLSMNGGFGGNGMWNNPIWAIVFLAALRNGGIFGNDGGNGYHSQLSQIQDTLNTNQGNALLMDAIKGNQTAIGQLSQAINCNQNAVIAAINAVQGAICGVGNQVGMGQMQIINAINSGDASLANQLQSCCCDLKTAVSTGFGNLRYESAAQTCDIKQSIANQTASVLAKLDAIEDSRKDREINSLTAALTAANSRAERAAELAPIYKAIEKIPNTVPVQWPQLTAIPTSQLYGYGVGYGFNPNGSIWS